MSPEAGETLLVYLQERARGPSLAANRGLEINPERFFNYLSQRSNDTPLPLTREQSGVSGVGVFT